MPRSQESPWASLVRANPENFAMSTPILDRYGQTFADLKKIQDDDLAKLKGALLPEVYEELSFLVDATNKERDNTTNGLHICPRGYQLFEMIRDIGARSICP